MSTGNLKIVFRFLSSNAKLPTRATTGSAGYDVAALNDVKIKPHSMEMISTGLAFEKFPENHCAQLIIRSSFGKKHCILSAGLLDEDYLYQDEQTPNEIKVILFNESDQELEIKAGENFAQFKIVPYIKADIDVVRNELVPANTDELIAQNGKKRRYGGFGSTNEQKETKTEETEERKKTKVDDNDSACCEDDVCSA